MIRTLAMLFCAATFIITRDGRCGESPSVADIRRNSDEKRLKAVVSVS
jgi:hypothetical protein